MQGSKKKIVSVKDKLDGNEIDLSLLELTEVPVKELAQVTRGTKLDLSNNKLTTLPLTFPSLVHLVSLDLSKNQLKELPVNFGDLRNLRSLDLYSNQLQRLPVSFYQLKELRWLDLKNNPLVPTLAEAAGDCLNEKECQEAARKVVKLMSVVHTELEKKRLKELEEAKAKQLAQKNEEDQAREQARLERKAEKDRKKAEAAKQQTTKPEPKGQNGTKSGKKSPKPAQHRPRSADVQLQGPSFCWRLFVVLLRLVFLAGLVSVGVFAANWSGPFTLSNAEIVARRSVDQASKYSQEIYEWLSPHLQPIREQWKHLSHFIADNGRDVVFIVWKKMVHYAVVVKDQAYVVWPLVQQRASEVSTLAVGYLRIIYREAPVYYEALIDKVTELYHGTQSGQTN